MGYFEISADNDSGETMLINKAHLPELIKISVFKADKGMPYSIEVYVPYANPVVFNNYMTQESAVKDKQGFIQSFTEWSSHKIDVDGKYIFTRDTATKNTIDAMDMYMAAEKLTSKFL